MNDYDDRQLKIMIDKIDLFRKGSLSFFNLINDLEGLLMALETKDLEWQERFRGLWANLEVLYAINLSNNKFQLDNQDRTYINDILSKLVELINEKLHF